MVTFKRVKTQFVAVVLASMSLCGFWCESIEPLEDVSENDCVDYFRYKADILIADSLKGSIFHGNELLQPGFFCCSIYAGGFGPYSYLDVFDSLSIKFSVLCNNQWLESRDYKFLNRKDAFTHIDYKEQTEGELMFDAELDSVCPGLSNYRITQYTDSECLEELNSK